jgi:hypothetical protein
LVVLGLSAALVIATAAACGGGSPPADREHADRPQPRPDPSVERALRDPAVARRLDRCGVTAANGSVPPGETPRPSEPAAAYHGRDGLWTVLRPRGVLVAEEEPDGTLSMKFPWWRADRGALKITGRRLDGDAAPLRARIPSGYGPIGFQSSALVFPKPGCWRVTGQAGDAVLTFVILVLRPRPQ